MDQERDPIRGSGRGRRGRGGPAVEVLPVRELRRARQADQHLADLANVTGGRGRGVQAVQVEAVRELQRAPQADRPMADLRDDDNQPSTSRGRGISNRGRCARNPQLDRVTHEQLDRLRDVHISDDQVRIGIVVPTGDAKYESQDTALSVPYGVIDKTRLPSACKPVELESNHTELIADRRLQCAVYNITFDPEDLTEDVKKAAMRSIGSSMGHHIYLGKKELFMEEKQGDEAVFYVTLNEVRIAVMLRFARMLNLSSSPSAALFSVYDKLVKHMMKDLGMRETSIGYVDYNKGMNLKSCNVIVMPGMNLKVRHCGRQTLTDVNQHLHVIVDPISRVYGLETVLQVMRTGPRGLFQHSRDPEKKKAEDLVVGKHCITSYNNIEYKILKVHWDRNPTSTFRKGDEVVTFVQYYQQHHGLTIQNLNQPLLEVRREVGYYHQANTIQDPIFIIPELCVLRGIPVNMLRNFQAMTQIKSKIDLNPLTAHENICMFLDKLATNEKAKDYLRQWGLVLSPDLKKTTGYCLQGEIIQGSLRPFQVDQEKYAWESAWSQKKIGVLVSKPIRHWIVVAPRETQGHVRKAIDMMLVTAKGMEFELAEPTILYFSAKKSTHLGELKKADLSNCHLVLIILPNDDMETYKQIKQFLTVEKGIASQCVRENTIKSQRLVSIVTKILLQIQPKLGGVPWTISCPLNQGFLVIGIETSRRFEHKSNWRDGVGCLVAHGFGVQPKTEKIRRQEYFDCATFDLPDDPNYLTSGSLASLAIAQHLCALVKNYKTEMRRLPSKIFVYRSGVSDSEVHFLRAAEFEVMLIGLKEVYAEADVHLAYIAVNANPSTLFMRPLPKSVNFASPKPGTVVDEDVTHPYRSDFFLVTDIQPRKIAKPTYYNIIGMTFDFNPGYLHRVTYQMCHLYYNWTGPTVMPAVNMNCRRLNNIVGSVLQKSSNASTSAIHERLKKTQFYL